MTGFGTFLIPISFKYSKKLNFVDENYSEYSLSEFKSDFMDLYFSTHRK